MGILFRLRQVFSGRKAAAQWPDALLLLSGALQSGMNLEEAFQILLNETPEPLKTSLNKKLGQGEGWLSLPQKIDRLFSDPELALTRGALLMSQEAGGKAASLLKTSSSVMRQKLELQEKARALTAQVRLTSWVVGLSPFVFLCLMCLLSPEMVRPLLTTRPGWLLLGLLALLVTAGLLLVHKMGKIEP